MPGQSPTAGALTAPSPLVSPPTESSFRDVNTTGDPDDPDTTSRPPDSTVMPACLNFTTAPAGIVSVTPDGTVTPFSAGQHNEFALGTHGTPVRGHVVSTGNRPPSSMKFAALSDPAFPARFAATNRLDRTDIARPV